MTDDVTKFRLNLFGSQLTMHHCDNGSTGHVFRGFQINVFIDVKKALIRNLRSAKFRAHVPQRLSLTFQSIMVGKPTHLTELFPPALFSCVIFQPTYITSRLHLRVSERKYL